MRERAGPTDQTPATEDAPALPASLDTTESPEPKTDDWESLLDAGLTNLSLE